MPSTDPPLGREEFWIRFVCSFIFFGALLALIGLRFIDTAGLAATAAVWAAASIAVSLFAARHGDEAWSKLIGLLRWW